MIMSQSQARRSLLHTELSRRAFAAGSLAAGFTLATGPLNAATIVTSSEGLDTAAISIPTRDGNIGGFRAKPKGKSNLPVMLVVQEIFGVHEHIRDLCRRFAGEGYYAIAPSLYDRYGDALKYSDIQTLVGEVVNKVPDNEVMSDLDSTLAFVSGDGGDASRAGIIGFCWGGRVVWLYAAHSDQIKAGVACYGRLRGEPDALRPRHPMDLVDALQAPVLGLYGGQDRGIPVADVEAMNEKLTAAGKSDSRIDLFPNAQHGFFADYRESYSEADAKEGWTRALSFLRGHGVK